MRAVFMDKSDKIFLPKAKTSEAKKVLFFANKTSNNLNQLAKKFNTHDKQGLVNKSLYHSVLNRLIAIEGLFKSALKKC